MDHLSESGSIFIMEIALRTTIMYFFFKKLFAKILWNKLSNFFLHRDAADIIKNYHTGAEVQHLPSLLGGE